MNGLEVARHVDRHAFGNYSGAPTPFTGNFTPDPSGVNRLHVTLWAGGGSEGLNYRAVVTYQLADSTSTGAGR